MKFFLASIAVTAAIACGSAAMAQSSGSAMSGDAMHGDAMHGDAMHGPKAMFACRLAGAGEAPTAKMSDGSGLVCKKIDSAMMMKGPGTPDSTPARMEDKAWLTMLEQYMYVGNN